MLVISLNDWPHLEELEKTFYEKCSYEQLLAYMAANGIGNYHEYFQDYQNVIKQYDILRKKLEQEVIFPSSDNKGGTWEVDFIEKEVKIREIAD